VVNAADYQAVMRKRQSIKTRQMLSKYQHLYLAQDASLLAGEPLPEHAFTFSRDIRAAMRSINS